MADNDNEIDAGAAAQDGAEGQTDELAALRNEVAELKERLLRALAETENTRRRAERDRSDASQYAVTKFARDILQVGDNLHRALSHLSEDAHAAAPPAIKAVLDGVEATERELAATLERHGVRAIDAEGGKFDPHLHQAIAEVAGDGKPAGSIVNVIQRGYVIADRLLRPAMVTVARASNDGGQTTGASPANDSNN
ncbi:MAG TPA: nucleotide exchange factor GrpE [Rhizomicrobium sp.]|jgi:molecular chaperone GrpE